MVSPHFLNTLSIDPDFTVLLSDPSNPNSGFEGKKKSNTVLIAATVGCVSALLLIAVVLGLLFWKNPHVRGFITGNAAQVATIGSKGEMQSMSNSSASASP